MSGMVATVVRMYLRPAAWGAASPSEIARMRAGNWALHNLDNAMSTTDLFQSIRCDDGEAVLEALRTCDLNQINELNQTLLQEAIAFGQWDVARELIERGIDLNRTDYQGATALHFAAAYSATELVERILAKGGACDVADAHGNEALWTATFNAKGKYAIVALLLKYGADPGHKNKAGRSPLELAQRMGYRQLAALLGGTDDAKTE